MICICDQILSRFQNLASVRCVHDQVLIAFIYYEILLFDAALCIVSHLRFCLRVCLLENEKLCLSIRVMSRAVL